MAYAARPRPSKADDCARRAMSGNSGLRKRLAARAQSWHAACRGLQAGVVVSSELGGSARCCGPASEPRPAWRAVLREAGQHPAGVHPRVAAEPMLTVGRTAELCCASVRECQQQRLFGRPPVIIDQASSSRFETPQTLTKSTTYRSYSSICMICK
jgi:hypothetical protein